MLPVQRDTLLKTLDSGIVVLYTLFKNQDPTNHNLLSVAHTRLGQIRECPVFVQAFFIFDRLSRAE